MDSWKLTRRRLGSGSDSLLLFPNCGYSMLRNIGAVVGIIVFIVVALVGAALLTGYITVSDPAEAAGQLLSGDVREPGVEIEKMEIGPVGVPEGSISDIDTGGMTVETEFSVNNTNAIGGKVDLIEYDAYMSGNPNGPYEFVGSGNITNLEIPPNATVTETNSFDTDYDDFATAMGLTGPNAVLTGSAYMRIEGVATIDMGPVAFSIEFKETREVS